MEEETGPLEVHVTHVRGDSKYLKLYIQFDRFALQRIQGFVRSISDELEHMQGYVHQCQLPIGSLVCIRANNDWFRGKVTAWTPANQQTVVVKYIDYGHEDIVKVNDLRKYETLFEYEPVAIECFLSDILPENGTSWSHKAVEMCHVLVSTNDKITCAVMRYYDGTPVVRVYLANLSLATTLLNHGIGIPCPESKTPASYARQTTPPGFSETINPGYQLPSNSYSNPSPPLNYNYPMRESFISNSLDPEFPHQVCVSHVERSGTFYIQLANGELERQSLNKALLTHMSSQSATPIMSYLPGTPCIAFCNEERIYQRATIVTVIGLEAQVFFVDSGIKEKKPVSELRVIPNPFLAIPVQAYECTLGPQLPMFDYNLFSEIVTGKILQCVILSHQVGRYVVCLYYNNKLLTDMMSARYMPVSNAMTPLPGYRYIKLPTKRLFQVQASLVASPKEMYFQLRDNVDQVLALMEQIHDFYIIKKRGVSVDSQQCLIGSAVCCYKAGENRFFRAEILEEPSNGRVKVQLVDFGNYVVASLAEIRELEPNFLALPAQAIRVSLHGMENIPEIVLNSQATLKKLEDLTIDQHLIVEVTDKLSDRIYSVILKTENDCVINEILIEEEVEVPVPYLREIEQIEITHYAGPKDFFGQLCNVPIDTLNEFVDNLHKHFSSLTLSTPFIPKVGQYVCAKFSENEMFYRAKVLSTQPNKVEVLYIDYGNKEIRGLDNIFPLTTEFSHLPRIGIHCAFSDVPDHVSLDHLSELMPESTIEVQILGESGGVQQVTLTDHPYNAILLKLWKKMEPKRLPYNQPSIALGAVEPVTIMDVTSFSKFSCQLQRNADNLDEMMSSLDAYYKSLRPQDKILENPAIDESCVAKYSEDGVWYRARVTEILSEDKLNVYFVDYGNSELVSSRDVKVIMEQYMKLPLYAVQCSLSEEREINSSPDEISRFKKEILEETFNAIFNGWDPVTKLHKVELQNPLTGISVALNYLKTKPKPLVSESNMWAGSNDGGFKGDSEARSSSNWNNKSPRRGEGNGQNSYRSEVGETRNAGSKGRKNSNRSDSISSSDESKGRLITKKNVDDRPVLVDFHYQDVKLLSYADILVTHVVNPKEFYAQLPEASSKVLFLLEEEMAEVYGNGTGCESIPRMKPNDPCAVLNPEDSVWYRGIVYNMLGPQIEVQLVDYGNIEVVPLANVKRLKPQFFILTVQAIKLGLGSIAPPEGRIWPIETIELFKKKVTDKCLVAQFLESKGKGSYSVNLIDADKLQTESMDQELVSMGLCKLENKQVLPNTLVKGLTIEPLEIPIGSKNVVSITWFKSYSKFFCQIESQPFIKLMEDIQAHYGSLTICDEIVERPLPETYCITQFSEDQGWYRAQIMTTKRNKVALFYVDYGNCDEVSRKFVKNIKKGFEKIPKQAILCYLNGVDSDETPSPEALENLFGGTLTCHFLGKKNDGYLVDIFNDGVSISQALVLRGVVKSIETEPDVAYVPVETNIPSPFEKISLQNGEYEVIVIYTESSQRFYCQKAEASIQIEELMDCMMRHFLKNQIPASQVEIGPAYVAKYSADDRWYRAIVLSVTENEAEVKFIDYGNIELVPKTMIAECTPELLECCPEFLELPEQAFECCLYGVAEKVPENLNNLFCDTVDNKELVISVKNKIGGVHMVSILDKSGPVIEDVGLKIFGEPLTYSQGYPPLTVPTTQCEVYISHVDSINHFYIQLKSQEELLAAIVEDLTLPQNRGPVLSNPIPGSACCAEYSEDRLWYRATILSVENELATVLFVDYGNTDICNLSTGSVTSSTDKLIKIPPIAFSCTLKDYQVSTESLDELTDQFTDVTSEKLLSAKFYGSNFPLQVELFDEGVNVADKFLLQSISVPVINNSTPAAASTTASSYLPAKVHTGSNIIYVSHIDNVNSFYVQLVSQTSVLDQIMEDLTQINPEGEIKLENAQPGSICVAPYSIDGAFYRAVVEEVAGGNCKVRFVDYGNSDIVATCSLLVPPPNLLAQSLLATECTLNQFQAVAGKEIEAMTRFHELVEDKELSGEFLGSDIPVKIELICNGEKISEVLKQEGLIEEVKTMLALPTKPESSNITSEIDSYPPWFFPPLTDAVPMNLSHVVALHKFYLQLWEKTDELSELGSALNEFYTNDGLIIDEIFAGMPCVAQFTEDESWYRAEIVSLNDGSVTVFFVDYGNDDVVPLDKIKRITKEFVSFPPYAIECEFKRLSPTNGMEKEVVEQISELTFERKLTVKFLTLTEMPYDVEITIDGENAPLSDKLILDGLARIIEQPDIERAVKESDNSIEFGMEATPEFILPVFIPTFECEVYVSHINSPESFFLTLQSSENSLSSLIEKMDEYCSSPKSASLDSIACGMACCSLYSADGVWYRAKVLETDGTSATVKFIDYGNDDVTPVDGLKKLSNDLILVPPYAFECKIKGLKVISGCDEEAYNLFEALTLDKTLCATFHSSQEPVEVKLYDGKASLENDISSKLLSSGLMMEEGREIKPHSPNEESVVDKFTDAKTAEAKLVSENLNETESTDKDLVVENIDQEKLKLDSEELILENFEEPETVSEESCESSSTKVDSEEISVENSTTDVTTISFTEVETDRLVSHSEPNLIIPSNQPDKVATGSNLVLVSHIDNVNSFYVQLVSQYPVLDQIVEDLSTINPEQGIRLDNAQPGTISIAPFSEDGVFYRAIVLEVAGDNCKVRFIDYGNSDTVPTCSLLVPPPNLLAQSPLAIECTLNQFQAVPGKEIDAVSQFRSLVGEREINGEFLSPNIPVKIELICDGHKISEVLKQEGLIEEIKAISENSTSEETTVFFTEVEVPLKHKAHTLVSHSVSPSEFYLNLMSETVKLEDMMNKLTEVYSSLTPNEMIVEEIIVGQACACLYLDDLHWYRCKVLEISINEVTVQFVDYGNIVQINKRHLKKIQPELLGLPTQAIKSSLHGVLPLDGDTEWSNQVCDELTSIFEKDGESRIFLTEFVDKIEDKVSVKLFDVGISVADVLEEKGFVQLEKEIQFPSVSSTGQLDESVIEEDSPIIRPRSREDKIVPGTIAMGRVKIEEEIRDKVERDELRDTISQREKPVPGFVTYLETEEVFSTSTDEDEYYSDQPNIEELKNRIVESSPVPVPRPPSRENKILPGLLSQGLMEEEQRILEHKEAEEKTPKGHDEKILPGSFVREENGLSESSKEERISDESFPSDISELLSEIGEPETSVKSPNGLLDQDIHKDASTPSEPLCEENSKSKIQPDVSVNGGLTGTESSLEAATKNTNEEK